MVSDLLNGISVALYDNFEGVTIYSESVEQGLTEPCFFIVPLNASEIPLLNNRAYRHVPFDVHYFPKSKTNLELEKVAAKLYIALRRITLPSEDQVNGMNLHHEVQDGVLHFFVEYKPVIYYKGDEAELLGTMTSNVGVKHEEGN